MAKGRKLVDVGTMAEALNLSDRRVAQLVADGLPRHARGQYPLDDCLRWYVRYLQKCLERKAIVGPDGDGGYNQVRLRRETAQAGLLEMELAEKQGQMIALDDVTKTYADLVLSTKARILAVPSRASGELVGLASRTDAQRVVEAHLKEALRQLEVAP